MALRFDEPSDVQHHECAECGSQYLLVKSFIVRDGDAVAITFAALHTHDGVREAWIDAILGTFVDDRTDDHLTFGCRVGPVEGRSDPAATLVAAATPYSDNPLWGIKPSRDGALAHDRLDEFWEVVDHVLVEDPTVRHHVYDHQG